MDFGYLRIRFLIPIAGIMIFIIAVLLGTNYSVRSQSCEFCHTREAKFTKWLIDEKAKEGFSHDQIACADCHFEGSSQGLLSAEIECAKHALINIVNFIDPRQFDKVNPVVENIPSKNCIYCHDSFDRIDEMYKEDLPENLKEIGLAMGHKKHYQIALEECAICHERFKSKDGEIREDKGVNYREYSHMSCDSCHKYIAHAYKKYEGLSSNTPYSEAIENAWVDLNKNRRWKVDIPSEESCRRCHKGKFHYQKNIFLADKDKDNNYKNCLKCHPSMTEGFFNNYKRNAGT
jgi:nitrate/TMAO reductase-like tetraheme cytochrome c subunit